MDEVKQVRDWAASALAGISANLFVEETRQLGAADRPAVNLRTPAWQVDPEAAYHREVQGISITLACHIQVDAAEPRAAADALDALAAEVHAALRAAADQYPQLGRPFDRIMGEVAHDRDATRAVAAAVVNYACEMNVSW